MHSLYSYGGIGYVGDFLAIAFLISLIAGIVLFFTFLNKKNEYRFSGFVGWLYDFLSFNKLMIDSLLKILYLILACYMTLGGFFMMFSSFLAGICMIVIGNVAVRLIYEFAMLLIIVCQNTSEINKKLGGDSTAREFVDNFGFESKNTAPQGAATGENYYQNFSQPNAQQNAQPQQQVFQQAAQQTQQPNAARTCSKCGATLSPDAIFCYNCGEKL